MIGPGGTHSSVNANLDQQADTRILVELPEHLVICRNFCKQTCKQLGLLLPGHGTLRFRFQTHQQLPIHRQHHQLLLLQALCIAFLLFRFFLIAALFLFSTCS
jgi:hypothetical protein